MCNAKRVYAMDYKVNWDSGGVFAVPDAAAEALRLASGKALKVLIYMLKYRRLPDDPDEIGVTASQRNTTLQSLQMSFTAARSLKKISLTHTCVHSRRNRTS